MKLSLKIAVLSTLIATILGTLMALALARYSFRGRSVTNFTMFMPMATPEIVMGSSLLTLFITLDFNRGFATILIAHIMFNISYVVVTVKARVYGFDRSMEEAAMDFCQRAENLPQVTLPLIIPACVAAALLASRCRSTTSWSRSSTRRRDHVPALHLRRRPKRRAGAGERDRLDDLPDAVGRCPST